ncbi:hypothetical protein [Saccharopolyspora griseoalba]|uniref:Glycoside hydrolase family 3 C-terminal domain-containing protein n=1 Tax=Saccharopolyspora griseoalba TaxID=1431848 RepID=A0ABW2LHK7_9PSEU
MAGKNADDVDGGGGWQGGSGPITPGPPSWRESGRSPGTEIACDRYGDGIDGSYRAGIAVVGETPCAEHEGDRPEGLGLDQEDLAALDASGVPMIAVTGPGVRWTSPSSCRTGTRCWQQPGSRAPRGAGVADVLFGDHNPTGPCR